MIFVEYMHCIVDVVHARRMRQQLAKTPTASIAQRLETIFFNHNHVWMHGAYANHSGSGEYITDASGQGVLFLPDFGSCETVDTPKSGSRVAMMHQSFAHSQNDVDSSMNVHKYEVNVLSREEDGKWGSSGGSSTRRKIAMHTSSSSSAICNEASSSDGSGSNGGGIGMDKPQRDKTLTDKTVIKKKWSQLAKTTASLMSSVNSSYGGVSRSSLEAVHELLSAAFSALPVPSDMLLGMDVTAQLQSDLPKVNYHSLLAFTLFPSLLLLSSVGVNKRILVTPMTPHLTACCVFHSLCPGD